MDCGKRSSIRVQGVRYERLDYIPSSLSLSLLSLGHRKARAAFLPLLCEGAPYKHLIALASPYTRALPPPIPYVDRRLRCPSRHLTARNLPGPLSAIMPSRGVVRIRARSRVLSITSMLSSFSFTLGVARGILNVAMLSSFSFALPV